MFDLANLDVCFLAGTLGPGGAERQLFYTLRLLKEKGTRVRLLCLTQREFWETRIRELGIPVIWVGQQGSRARRLARIVRELRRDRPDVIHSQHFYTNLYTVAAARALRIREIGAIRNDCISEVRANGPVLGRLSLRTPGTVAANSQAGIKNAIAMGVSADRLHFLPNLVDTDRFKPGCRSCHDHNQKPVTLIAVGRLVEQKRIDRFLSIVATLRTQFNGSLKAIIAGDGAEREQLELQAGRLGLLPDVVEFRETSSEISTLYQEADVLVLTSDWEGTPNVVLEAMASGLPVVATRVGGVPEIVRDGETGYLSGPADERGITDSLKLLISEPLLRERMGRRAREYVMEHHSADRLCVALNDIYKAVLA